MMDTSKVVGNILLNNNMSTRMKGKKLHIRKGRIKTCITCGKEFYGAGDTVQTNGQCDDCFAEG